MPSNTEYLVPTKSSSVTFNMEDNFYCFVERLLTKAVSQSFQGRSEGGAGTPWSVPPYVSFSFPVFFFLNRWSQWSYCLSILFSYVNSRGIFTQSHERQGTVSFAVIKSLVLLSMCRWHCTLLMDLQSKSSA